MGFLKNNFLYVLWFAFYFFVAWLFFGANLQGFYIVAIIYGVSIAVALSPIGEVILRILNGAREPSTSKEKEYLEDVFQEVYEKAREENKNLSKNIKIYITDEMYPNAFACGRNTIAVTRVAINVFTEDELKGILAHEFGHLNHGHTKALVLTIIGNILFSIITIIIQLILQIMDSISSVCANMSRNIVVIIIAGILKLSILVLNMYLFVIDKVGQLLLSANSRKNEYQADKFALINGYGEELLSALYLIQEIEGNYKLTMFQKMTMSHPHIAKRIGELEKSI